MAHASPRVHSPPPDVSLRPGRRCRRHDDEPRVKILCDPYACIAWELQRADVGAAARGERDPVLRSLICLTRVEHVLARPPERLGVGVEHALAEPDLERIALQDTFLAMRMIAN